MAYFCGTDPLGNSIVLSDDIWEGHILNPLSGHPEVAGYRADVEAAIVTPTEVWSSKWHPDRVVYYRPLAHRPGLMVAVVADTRAGEVCTAHLIRERRRKGGVKLWP